MAYRGGECLQVPARLSLHNKSYRSEARVLVEVSAHLSIGGGARGKFYEVFLQEEFWPKMRHGPKLLHRHELGKACEVECLVMLHYELYVN